MAGETCKGRILIGSPITKKNEASWNQLASFFLLLQRNISVFTWWPFLLLIRENCKCFYQFAPGFFRHDDFINKTSFCSFIRIGKHVAVFLFLFKQSRLWID